MSEDEQEKSSKTEEPTHKRLEEARKKGQVPTSREVNSFFIILCLTFLVMTMAPGIMKNMQLRLSHYITGAHDIDVDAATFKIEMQDLLADTLSEMFLPALAAIAAVFAANLVQNRFVISLEPVMPKLNKISPLKGIGRMFSMRSIVEFVKGIIKIIIVGAVAVIAVWPDKERLEMLPDMDMMDLLAYTATVTGRILIGVCIITFLIAILDFAYQKFEYMRNLRMTKQELKDEYKQQEGDPLVKQKLRQIRREKARKRMMEAVPRADVIITNPTHYAIALQYDQATMSAPHVIAKGKDKVAFRIKEIAEKNKIVIMRNPALARLLYDNAPLDEEIPLEYFKAVAEIIGYVYKLKGVQFSKRKQK